MSSSSSSPSDVRLIETLTLASKQLNRYLPLFIFSFGIIGNILNTLVLSQRKIRLNPCIFLFLCSSISNLISILCGLMPRILSGWNIDLTDTNQYHCKLRAFIMFTSRTIAFWLIVFATIDRWILSLSDAQRRQMSTLKNAHRGALIITIISILFYLHMFYCYEPNLVDAPLKCYGKTACCRLLTDITYACFTILLPLILMIIFGLTTISNIRDTRSCISVDSITTFEHSENLVSILRRQQSRRWKKLDRYLLRMLLLQVILLICFTLPQTVHKLYLTLTFSKEKSEWQLAIDRFIYNFDLLLPYLASGMPFYVYTLTGGKVFQNALRNVLCYHR
jgi:hypothetical protein